MALWRRISAIVLAAAMAVSPALACADFCPSPDTVERQADGQSSANAEASVETADVMPEDCADAMGAPPNGESQTPAHDPDCQGCSDCPAIASVKNPALGFGGAVSVDAPTVISLDLAGSPVANNWRPMRHRITPPANGPPARATPVILKDILRI